MANSQEDIHVTSNVSNSTITVTAHFKTTDSTYSGRTDGVGAGIVSFRVGSPTKGYTVVVSVDVGGRASCSTSFTP